MLAREIDNMDYMGEWMDKVHSMEVEIASVEEPFPEDYDFWNKLTFIWSGFGYELYKDEEVPFGSYLLLHGDGTPVCDDMEGLLTFDNTLQAKKWMKENKTSNCWRADGKWDWSREESCYNWNWE